MTRSVVLALSLGWVFSLPAVAKDPGDEAYMIRMLACEGPDAKMELYLPQSIVFGRTPLPKALAQPVIGYYTLDLTDANKRKPLEPVKVSMAADGKTVIINQYTRAFCLSAETLIEINRTAVYRNTSRRQAAPPFQFQVIE